MVTERCRRLRLPHLTHRTRSVVRPRIASRLKGEIATIGVVIAFCKRRGGGWWPLDFVHQPGRTATVVAWPRRYETDLRLRVDADVDTRDPLMVAEFIQVRPVGYDYLDAGGRATRRRSETSVCNAPKG
jgi:hypothetical protein